MLPILILPMLSYSGCHIKVMWSCYCSFQCIYELLQPFFYKNRNAEFDDDSQIMAFFLAHGEQEKEPIICVTIG